MRAPPHGEGLAAEPVHPQRDKSIWDEIESRFFVEKWEQGSVAMRQIVRLPKFVLWKSGGHGFLLHLDTEAT
jgi:hypothetical protein